MFFHAVVIIIDVHVVRWPGKPLQMDSSVFLTLPQSSLTASMLEQAQPGPLSDSTWGSPEIYIKRIPAAPRDSISCSSSRRHLTVTPRETLSADYPAEPFSWSTDFLNHRNGERYEMIVVMFMSFSFLAISCILINNQNKIC